MQIRCTYCRHSFNLSRDYMIMAVAESTEKGLKYHGVECINCRKTIKVPLSQMKRYVPAPAPNKENEGQAADD